jgi:hypothetical protein
VQLNAEKKRVLAELDNRAFDLRLEDAAICTPNQLIENNTLGENK